jgi:N-acetylglucosamine kinase-like BadF-type ATPase
MIAIGVDGGGSKTDVALVRDDGEALALRRGGASHTHHLGVGGALDVIEATLDEALTEAGIARGDGQVAEVATLTLAGADFPDEVDAITAAVEARGWSLRTVVLNDTFAVLRAGTDEGWGVAVVCGSGLNCVGVAPDGTQVRFPSLGAISGDWGGGYDIGIAGAWAAARSEDGRGPKTTLEQAVPAHFGLATPHELALAIHRGSVAQRRLIELAPLVFAEAADDPVAAEIVARLADELAAIAGAAVKRLGLAGERTQVLLGGGIIQRNHATLVPLVQASLRSLGPSIEVHATSSPPVVGAALLALDELGATPAARARLRAELDARFETMSEARSAVAAARDDG